MLVAKDMLRLPAPGGLPIAGRFVFGAGSEIAAVLPRGGQMWANKGRSERSEIAAVFASDSASKAAWSLTKFGCGAGLAGRGWFLAAIWPLSAVRR